MDAVALDAEGKGHIQAMVAGSCLWLWYRGLTVQVLHALDGEGKGHFHA